MNEGLTIDSTSVKAIHLENRGTHGQDDHSKRVTETKRRGEKLSCTHCEKEGHDEENCWKLHPELRPKRNDRKGKQMVINTMQQSPDSKLVEDEKVTTIGFAWGRPIYLVSDSYDELKLAELGSRQKDP